MIDLAALNEAADALEAYALELQLSSTRQGVAGLDWSSEPDAKAAFDRDRSLAARLRAVAALLDCFRPVDQTGESVGDLNMPTPLELLEKIRLQDYLSDTVRHRIDRVLDLAAVTGRAPVMAGRTLAKDE